MKPITGLNVARIVIGVVALVTPGWISAMFRLGGSGDTRSEFLTRMFGAREIALGVATLAAPANTRLVALGMAVDATDAAAGVLAARSGGVDRVTSVALTVPGLSAVVAGAYGLVTGRR